MSGSLSAAVVAACLICLGCAGPQHTEAAPKIPSKVGGSSITDCTRGALLGKDGGIAVYKSYCMMGNEIVILFDYEVDDKE
tara:strand:- start:2702 stop:2944 length:243 start_codon:yes stop_codon:yes gene_type:complete